MTIVQQISLERVLSFTPRRHESDVNIRIEQARILHYFRFIASYTIILTCCVIILEGYTQIKFYWCLFLGFVQESNYYLHVFY